MTAAARKIDKGSPTTFKPATRKIDKGKKLLPLKPAARPSPLAVFIARAEARALLWKTGALDLHEAVDALQASAVRNGLVAELGQDEVQRLMVEAFAPVREDPPKFGDISDEAPDIPLPVRFPTATFVAVDDDDYAGLSSTFAALCRKADEKQRRHGREKPATNVALVLAASTIMAAEYLVQRKDPACMRSWLGRHTAQECDAILQHLGRRKRARAS